VNVLVTGASGFFGGAIARGLADAGHSVRGLVRASSRWDERPATAVTATGDVTDVASIGRAATGCDTIVHAAAHVKVWAKDPSEFDRVNVGGLRNAAAVAADKGARLVYVSSFIALGPTDGATFDEDTPRATSDTHNDYERTKRDADLVARSLAAEGRSIVRVYPGVLYGPGPLTPGNHVVGALLQHAQGKLPGMLGKGDRRMCFTYVEDAVRGIVTIVERAATASAYVLGGDNRTMTELFDAFARESGVAPPKRHVPFAFAELLGKVYRWRAELFGIEPELTDEVVRIYRHEWAYDSTRAQRDLGYRITPLSHGIARTVAWLRSTGRIPRA
jgi:farnesol dehydrogenase